MVPTLSYPAVSRDPTQSKVATLSQEFSDFLIELSLALNKHAIYPAGHPSLEPAAASVTKHARRLLEDRELLAFGVARRQLVIEGVATDPDHPVLGRLAEELHRHQLGAVSVLRGVQPEEIGAALTALAGAGQQDPLGLQPPDRMPAWPHVRLHPLTFEGLSLIGDADLIASGDGAGSAKEAELWIGLARAAMASDAAAKAAAIPTDPAVVAQAIDAHQGREAYDQVIVGHMLQIARQLSASPGDQGASLRRRTAGLISQLKPDTLQRLVQMGGDVAQRRSFVSDAAHGMTVEAVLKIVKAAAEAGGETVSHGLFRMLSKMAVHAESGSTAARPRADAALREQVDDLLADWDLEDPNPEEYGQLLQNVATMAEERATRGNGDSLADKPEALRVAQMSLEIGAIGPVLERAVDELAASGSVGAILELLATLPIDGKVAASTILTRLAQPGSIALLAQDPVDFASLDRLLPFMPLESWDKLLDALAASDVRKTRRQLLERLASSIVDIGELVVARLEDPRWFVQRNMLVLLERSRRIPAGFSAIPWTTHEHARVRHSAIRLQLLMPEERDLAIRSALENGDPHLVRMGLAALGTSCPPEFAGLLVNCTVDQALSDEARVLAIRLLAASQDQRVVDALLAVIDGGKTTFLRRQRIALPRPVVLAALRVLASSWPNHPRVASMLRTAARSKDPDVREAVRGARH